MKSHRNVRIALILLCSMLTAFVATPFLPDLPAVIVGAAAIAEIFFTGIKMSRGCSPANWTAHRAETSHARWVLFVSIMPEFIAINGGLINLEHIMRVERTENGVAMLVKFPDGTSMRVVGDQMEHLVRALQQHNRSTSREERAAWANEAVLVSNELVGDEVTAQKRRDLVLRLLGLSERIAPKPLMERRAG